STSVTASTDFGLHRLLSAHYTDFCLELHEGLTACRRPLGTGHLDTTHFYNFHQRIATVILQPITASAEDQDFHQRIATVVLHQSQRTVKIRFIFIFIDTT
ncbi:unnamed protein product, partial [Ectocarpus sp. 4 AP-2014]